MKFRKFFKSIINKLKRKDLRKVFSVLKITLLVLLSVLFLFMLTATLAIGVFDRDLLKEGFYKEQLKDADFYERVYTDVMPEIKELPSYYGGITVSEAEKEQLVREIIPADWLQEQVEEALHSVIPWLRSRTDSLNMTIDLEPAKQRASSVVLDFVGQKLTGLPECPPGKEPDLSLVAYGNFPDCLPEKPDSPRRIAMVNEIIPLIAPYINGNIASAPDNLDIIEEAAEEDNKTRDEFLERFDSVRHMIDWLVNKIGLFWAYFTMVVLLALIALLNIGLWRALFRWVGGTMLFSALPLLIIGLYANIAGPGLIENHMEEGIDDVPAGIIKLGSDMSGSAIRDISWTFLIPVIVITVIGLTLFILSFIIQRKKETSGDREIAQADTEIN